MREATVPVFFDRAIPELSGYGNAPGESDPLALTAAIADCRYNDTVYVFPPWQAIYSHDAERKHDFAHAIAVFEEIVATYRRFGYETLEIPRTAVAERLCFVLSRIDTL
jgi:predicted ATPase